MKVQFIVLFFLLGTISGFKVYWNVPTQQCRRYLNFVNPLKTFGIRVNDDDNFQGNQITIFYEAQLGLYPRILKSEEIINGGIPQLGNLEKHLEQAAIDLEKIIPSKNFDGLGVIDWEAWRPTWEFNWTPFEIYKTKSRDLAKKLNPTASTSEVEEIAVQQWENSTRSYMLETINLAKRLRPNALWCYYLFPDCYNYSGKKWKDFQCSAAIRKGNDKLSWLWKASTAICPSIYLYDSYLDRYSAQERAWRDNERLREALRVAPSNAQIFPYVNYYTESLIPKDEMWRSLAQSAAIGAHGAVIWGASASVSSKEKCENLKQYIIETLGPAAEKVAWRSDLCSKQICNGIGRCTFPKDDDAIAWKLFIDDSNAFFPGNITCRCPDNYSGQFCNVKSNEV